MSEIPYTVRIAPKLLEVIEKTAQERGIAPRKLIRAVLAEHFGGDGRPRLGGPIDESNRHPSLDQSSTECEHFLITGATGAGKSMAIRSLLRQLQARGELAIVVDPECEYVSEFYRRARGDLILNPVDERCPYWSPDLWPRAGGGARLDAFDQARYCALMSPRRQRSSRGRSASARRCARRSE